MGIRYGARAAVVAAAAALVLAGCKDVDLTAKHMQPLSRATKQLIDKKGMAQQSPIFVRIFKEESALEVWKEEKETGRFALLKTYDICAWSGELGPKLKEGDKQAPEGFYTVTPAQMNPNSSYYLSFNLGFPNSFDRAHGRTGSHLMVHGACSSAGCYSMTDEQIAEIYALGREAFIGGQRAFQVQAFPFRMTPENMARHRDSPNMGFWRMLKEGHDHFEVTRVPPKVDVCSGRYVFNAEPRNGRRLSATEACPELNVPEALRVAVEREVGTIEGLRRRRGLRGVEQRLPPYVIQAGIRRSALRGGQPGDRGRERLAGRLLHRAVHPALDRRAGQDREEHGAEPPALIAIHDGDGGLDDMSIGCEACHGPGSEHIAEGPSRGKAIVVPGLLAAERASMICGRCHTRGEGKGTIGGAHTAATPRAHALR